MSESEFLEPGIEDTPLEKVRHSTAHIMAQAILRLWPNTQLAFGPTIENGFYYDLKIEDYQISMDDFEKIELEMKKVIKENLKFERSEMSHADALEYFKERNQPFKIDQIEKLNLKSYSIYKQGDFTDLCSGPHVNYTKKCKHFKLLNLSGAYFRADTNNPQLQRIYGTSWDSKENLVKHLFQLEEAKKRDHRKLGQALELFEFHEEAPGCVFWQPNGTTLYEKLSEKSKVFHIKCGYQEVRTPIMFNKKLWEKSGHWEHYKDDMFIINDMDEVSEGRDGTEGPNTMSLKPMNCPSHMLMYKNKKRSYKELPIRFHDKGVLHRNELSGALSGLTRVRQFCQDDAHLFVRNSQIEEEVNKVLAMIKSIYSAFDMPFKFYLSTRNPNKFMGEIEVWDKAEKALEDVLKQGGFEYEITPNDAAFYGPKIDCIVYDSLGRGHQCATTQLDFQLPINFDLTYVDEASNDVRPVVIHRAIYGSFERFIGILIEHYAGNFPTWLAPVQVKVLPISEKVHEYANKVQEELINIDIRSEVDSRSETINMKIRENKMKKIPYLLVLGGKEEEAQTVTFRSREDDSQQTISLEEFKNKIAKENEFSF
ncbi:MAG: threonine--tRNA ligase [Planctomycetota bacterium]|nr:MAG: threonine--tRNA ligase [Planctomycetota bacterium]